MSMAYIPDEIRGELSNEVIKAIDILHRAGLDKIEAFFQLDTGEFVGLGFVGPDGRFTRPANPETLTALEIVEQRYKTELRERVMGMNTWWRNTVNSAAW